MYVSIAVHIFLYKRVYKKLFMNRRRPSQPTNKLCCEMSMSYYYYLMTILSSSECQSVR